MSLTIFPILPELALVVDDSSALVEAVEPVRPEKENIQFYAF